MVKFPTKKYICKYIKYHFTAGHVVLNKDLTVWLDGGRIPPKYICECMQLALSLVYNLWPNYSALEFSLKYDKEYTDNSLPYKLFFFIEWFEIINVVEWYLSQEFCLKLEQNCFKQNSLEQIILNKFH